MKSVRRNQRIMNPNPPIFPFTDPNPFGDYEDDLGDED